MSSKSPILYVKSAVCTFKVPVGGELWLSAQRCCSQHHTSHAKCLFVLVVELGGGGTGLTNEGVKILNVQMNDPDEIGRAHV